MSDAARCHVRQLSFCSETEPSNQRTVRLDIRLKKAPDGLDAVDRATIGALRRETKVIIDTQGDELFSPVDEPVDLSCLIGFGRLRINL